MKVLLYRSDNYYVVDSPIASLSFPICLLLTLYNNSERNISLEHFAWKAGVTEHELKNPMANINGEQLKSAIYALTSVSQTRPASLEIATNSKFSDFGLIGITTRSARSLSELLLIYKKCLHQALPAVSFELSRADEHCLLQIGSNEGLEDTTGFVVELFMALLVKTWAAKKFPVLINAIEFSHDPQFPLRDYESFFGASVSFGTGFNRIYFNDDIGIDPNDETNELIWRDRIEEYLKLHVNCLDQVSKDSFADAYGISPRTLTRRLQQENTTYKELFDDFRRRYALSTLKQGGKSITHISEVLGFSDTRAFRGAFKRWTGSSVSEYREMLSEG